jgi:hypothetical protein
MMQKSPHFTTIIFSKDRAMQLDATLNSFFRHCQDAEKSSIFVLYLTTSEHFEQQYQSLAVDYPNVAFLRQTHFRRDLLQVLSADISSKRDQYLFNCWSSLSVFSLQKKFIRRLHKKIILPQIGQLIPRIPADQ